MRSLAPIPIAATVTRSDLASRPCAPKSGIAGVPRSGKRKLGLAGPLACNRLLQSSVVCQEASSGG